MKRKINQVYMDIINVALWIRYANERTPTSSSWRMLLFEQTVATASIAGVGFIGWYPLERLA